MLKIERRAELAKLEGLILEETGLCLAELAATVPADRTILEIGTFKGKSACYLASGAKAGLGAPVVSIDPWTLPGNRNGRNEAHLYADVSTPEIFKRQVEGLNLEGQITQIQGFAANVARGWEQPIGMLFIDANHVYGDVRRDYENFARHLQPGAIVVFDDYATRNHGVTQFVDQLRRKQEFARWDMGSLPLAVGYMRGIAAPAPPPAKVGSEVILSTVIMAHPKRERFINDLRKELGDVDVVWDEKNDRWDTGRRSMLAYDRKATHHLVVQDDAILCRDFLEGVRRAIRFVPNNPVSFYTGSVRPNYQYVSTLAKLAERDNTHWLQMEGPWWGVAVAIPTRMIERMVEWADTNTTSANYDTRMALFFKAQKIPCYYSAPSLVSHRTGLENPSLVPGRGSSQTRIALNFIGADHSALEVKWSSRATVGARR